MNVMRTFLSSSDFIPVVDHIRRRIGVDVERFDTMHQLVTLMMQRGTAIGTRDFRLQYSIADRGLDSASSCGVLSLCLDWAIANGAKMEHVVRLLGIAIATNAFRPVVAPQKLARFLRRKPLSDLDPNIEVVQAALAEQMGVQAVVPVDGDRLAPVFAQDSNALGRYAHIAVNPELTRRFQHDAERFVKSLDKMKEKDVRFDDLRAAFYRILGLLTIQAFYHVDALTTELVHDGDLERRARGPLKFSGNPSWPWIVLEVQGVLESLHHMMAREGLEVSQKVLALSYLADLPLRTALGCVTGARASEERDSLLESIIQLFDTLTEMGLVVGRLPGSESAGELSANPPDRAAVLKDALSEQYPSLDWRRRWRAIDRLVQTLAEAEFQTRWDSRSEPPDLWAQWAKETVKRGASKSEAENNAQTDE